MRPESSIDVPCYAAIPPRPAPWTAQFIWGWLGILAIVVSLYTTGLFRQDIFNPGGVPQFVQFFAAALHPDFSTEFLCLVWDATWVTLSYAVCGTFLSIIVGLIGGIFGSEVWWFAVFPRRSVSSIWLTIRAVLTIPRAIHELIWGLFFVNLFGLDPLVGILAIAVPYSAIVAKVFSELLDETPRQPLVTLINSGVAPAPALLYTLLPQAFLDLLSYTFYRFECSIRSAAVLGIIGAGGLGYQILLSLQSLRYEQLWTLFLALFLLNGSVDFCSAVLRKRLGSPSRLDLNLRKSQKSRTDLIHTSHSQSSIPTSLLWQHLPALATIATVLMIPFCFGFVQADFSKLWLPRTFTLLQAIGETAWPPHVDQEQLTRLWNVSLQTLAMSIVAIGLAGVGGILLSFPAAHTFFLAKGLFSAARPTGFARTWAWIGLLATRLVLLVCRAIPAPIWALVMLFVLFPGILPGAIALGIHNLGILGRLMAEVNENLDQRPLLALKAQGTPAGLVFLYGVLPLTLTRFLSYILYRWEVCTRETVIVGLVGAGGLGRLLTEQLSSFDYRSVIVTLGSFMLLTVIVDGVSAAARRSLR